MWFHQESWLLRKIGPNVGPILLSICCLVTSATCLLTTRLVKKFGYMRLITAHYIILCIFLLIHMYPTFWLLLPAYALLGLTLGPTWICKWNLVVDFARRISCGQHECPTATAMMSESGIMDEHKGFCNRNERVRRLARYFHAVQDIGIFIGALIASIIISCAATESNCILTQQIFKLNRQNTNNSLAIDNFRVNTLNDTHRGIDNSFLSRLSFLPNKSKTTTDASELDTVVTTSASSPPTTTSPLPLPSSAQPTTESNTFAGGLSLLKYYQESFFSQHNELLDSVFNTNERGVRICGAGSCPTWNHAFENNGTEEYNWFTFSGTIPMTLFYVSLAAIALFLSCLSQQVDNTFKYEHFKGITDTLLLASPMAYFIGTEQAYMLGGFTRVSHSTCLLFSLAHKVFTNVNKLDIIFSHFARNHGKEVKHNAILCLCSQSISSVLFASNLECLEPQKNKQSDFCVDTRLSPFNIPPETNYYYAADTFHILFCIHFCQRFF